MYAKCFFLRFFIVNHLIDYLKFDIEYFKALLKYDSCVFIAVYIDEIEREKKLNFKNPINPEKNLLKKETLKKIKNKNLKPRVFFHPLDDQVRMKPILMWPAQA